MPKKSIALAVIAGLCYLSLPAMAGTDKDVIALQQSVSMLLGEVSDLQKGFNTQVEVIKSLVAQNTDTVAKAQIGIGAIQETLNGQITVANQRKDDTDKQMQALSDSIGELTARLDRIDASLKQVQQMQQNIQAPPAAAPSPAPGAGLAGGGGMASGEAAAPLQPQQLFQNALSDFNANNLTLAQSEFAQFVQTYPQDPSYPDASYYLGTILATRQDYTGAIQHFSDLLERYPDNAKASAAQLDEGMALVSLGKRAEAISEFKALELNYKGSPEARQAAEELTHLGATAKPTTPHVPH